MKVAEWRKSQHGERGGRKGGGSSTNRQEEELAKGRKGGGKKVKLIFVRAWALSLSLSLSRSLSLSSFLRSIVGSKSFPCLPSRKLPGIRGTLIPQIDDFTKWYEAVWENGESHGKKDKPAQPAGCCPSSLPDCARKRGYKHSFLD